MITLALYILGCWLWPISMPIWYMCLGFLTALVEFVILGLFTAE